MEAVVGAPRESGVVRGTKAGAEVGRSSRRVATMSAWGQQDRAAPVGRRVSIDAIDIGWHATTGRRIGAAWSSGPDARNRFLATSA
jgi:hypothetical protein